MNDAGPLLMSIPFPEMALSHRCGEVNNIFDELRWGEEENQSCYQMTDVTSQFWLYFRCFPVICSTGLIPHVQHILWIERDVNWGNGFCQGWLWVRHKINHNRPVCHPSRMWSMSEQQVCAFQGFLQNWLCRKDPLLSYGDSRGSRAGGT